MVDVRFYGLMTGLCLLLLAGCATSAKILEATGLKTPALPEGVNKESLEKAIPKVREVTLRIHAGSVINADGLGRALPTVTRIYKLRDATAFLQSPYAAFQTDARSSPPGRSSPPVAGDESPANAPRTSFGQDVIESRELVVTPGMRHEVVEKLPSDVRYVAVVSLFRSPAEGRWRFVFDTKNLEDGITVGMHACALSVAAGRVVGAAPEDTRLAGVQCK